MLAAVAGVRGGASQIIYRTVIFILALASTSCDSVSTYVETSAQVYEYGLYPPGDFVSVETRREAPTAVVKTVDGAGPYLVTNRVPLRVGVEFEWH